jgi:phosphonate dehydrogenase
MRRGAVVDEEAIADALDSGRVAGHAADVFAFEDRALPECPNSVVELLRTAPPTLLTSHQGSAVASVRRAIDHCAADDIMPCCRSRGRLMRSS